MLENNIFENIKHYDENGNEYWCAREFMKALEYRQWRRFEETINRAISSCELSNLNVTDHFAKVGKMIILAKGARREISDYRLSRYACYLIAQNGDSRKLVIALAQTYFAIQTRKMEIIGLEYSNLSEDDKRLYQRELTKKGNLLLNQTAKNAGVKNFDKFHNFGYKGLYNGETANDIAKRKKLRYREEILDNMGSDELIANLFRISQTEQKLKKENIRKEDLANKTHYIVGKKIRQTIEELGGTMPEKMPTPRKSIKDIEHKQKIKINSIEK